MRRLIMATGFVGVLAALMAAWLANDWLQFRQRPLTDSGITHLWLDKGTSLHGMVRQLEHLGLTRLDWRWRLLGRVESPLLQAGEYRIAPGMNADQLL